MFKKLTLITALACSAGAHAGMISDYSLDGNVVKNSATGQEWLQWTETRGLSAQNATSQYASDGWRIANAADMANLYSDFFPEHAWTDDLSINQQYLGVNGDGVDNAKAFNVLFGATVIKNGIDIKTGIDFTPIYGNQADATVAFFSANDPSLNTFYKAYVNTEYGRSFESARIDSREYSPIKYSFSTGVALIRQGNDAPAVTVSEPGTLALLGLGLVGLAGVRKRSNHK